MRERVLMMLTPLALGSCLLLSGTAHGDVNPHPYPRLGAFHFGRAPADWYARFDYVHTGVEQEKIKQLNPDALLFVSRDWMVANNNVGGMPTPDEWILKDASGNKIPHANGWYMNISNHCAAYEGKRWNEVVAELAVQQAMSSDLVDGFISQGVWAQPALNDIDMNENGLEDHGDDDEINVREQWLEGVHTAATMAHGSLSAAGKLLVLNSGDFHDFEWEVSNGFMLEKYYSPFNFPRLLSKFQSWKAVAPHPHIPLVDWRGKADDFQKLRYLLTATLVATDMYFSYTEWKAGEHNYHKYYDEYDATLGQPTTEALQLPCEHAKGYTDNLCPHVRFFDHGVVIVNPSGWEQTVTDASLQAFADYYDGPYYRFVGGQDPTVNDGSMMDSITLYGEFSTDSAPTWPLTFGDGVVLLNEPRVVVGDIIVDDVHVSTSPGTEPAMLEGTWHRPNIIGNSTYCQKLNAAKEFWCLAKANPDDGESKATFVPTIGVAGAYEVYEWHGFLGDEPASVAEATNVPYVITYGDGETATGSIDQSVAHGQWNLLGTYEFAAGTTGSIEISNDGVDGVVMADAIKLVFTENTPVEGPYPTVDFPSVPDDRPADPTGPHSDSPATPLDIDDAEGCAYGAGSTPHRGSRQLLWLAALLLLYRGRQGRVRSAGCGGTSPK